MIISDDGALTNHPAVTERAHGAQQTIANYAHASSAYSARHDQPTQYLSQPTTAGCLTTPYYAHSAQPASQPLQRPHINQYAATNTVYNQLQSTSIDRDEFGQIRSNICTRPTCKEPQNYQQQQLYNWLNLHDLSRYYTNFIDAGIESIKQMSCIENMSDIKLLGISSIFDGKKLLKALQANAGGALLENSNIANSNEINLCDLESNDERLLHFIIDTQSCDMSELQKNFDLKKQEILHCLMNLQQHGYVTVSGKQKGYRISKKCKKDALKYTNDERLKRIQAKWGAFAFEKVQKKPPKKIRKRKVRQSEQKYFLRKRCDAVDAKTNDDEDTDHETSDEEASDSDECFEPALTKRKLVESDFMEIDCPTGNHPVELIQSDFVDLSVADNRKTQHTQTQTQK